MGREQAEGGGLRPGWVWAIYAALTVVVLAPVASVQVPVLGDYLNHLARISILARIGGSPALQKYYDTAWKFVPYYGMDVPVLLLAHVMPIYDAGRVFVAACVMMPVVACAVLRRAVHGRVGLMPVLAYLVCYNYVLERGFLNYLFSAGLAIMLFAGWVACRDWPRWRRCAVFAAGALALYFAHVFAFLAYGVLVGGCELGRAWRGRRLPGVAAADIAAAAAQALPALAMAWWGSITGMVGTVNATRYGSLDGRLAALLSPLYFPGQSWIIGACLIVPLSGVGLVRWFRLAPLVWPALVAALLAACCLPHVLFNLWGADFRLPLVAAVVLLGGLSTTLARRWRLVGLGVLAVLVTLRSADAFRQLHAMDRQVADVRQVAAALPLGVRLLVVDGDEDAPGRVAAVEMTAHLGLVAAIDRDAFVPFLFSGATALVVRPAFEASASPNAAAMTLPELRAPVLQGPPPAWGFGGHIYWVDWPDKFDYVLIIHFGQRLDPLPANLRPLAANRTASLYQIMRW